MFHTPTPPEPLIIQGAHFEFREPQILPVSGDFPNFKIDANHKKDAETRNFYIFSKAPNTEKIGLLVINQKEAFKDFSPKVKAVFIPNTPTQELEQPQIIFQLEQPKITSFDNNKAYDSAYHHERGEAIMKAFCLDFETQYMAIISRQFGQISHILQPTTQTPANTEKARKNENSGVVKID